MKLVFRIYQLKQDSIIHKVMVTDEKKPNEFIVVGEKSGSGRPTCFLIHQLENDGITFVGGKLLDEVAHYVEKEDIFLKGDEIIILNVPHRFLDEKLVENIKRLNK